MLASWTIDDILRAGINHHMSQLHSKLINSTGKIPVAPRQLYFDMNTIEKVVKSKEKLPAKQKPNDMLLFVKISTEKTGKTIQLNLNADYKVEEVKNLIYKQEGVPPEEQCLGYPGRWMEDGKTLKDYNVIDRSCIHMERRMGGGCMAYEMEKGSFAPEWNYDFTKITIDEYRFSRGGSLYIRPLGSMRYALKVLGKYENDDWLGVQQNRRNVISSLDTEWPVAYHGTTDPRAAEIVRSGGFDLAKGVRFKYGYGIYCTPDPRSALAYAASYTYKGHQYKLVVQARVDPTRRDIVPKSIHGVAGLDDYWIVKENDAIRPYGICVYPC